MKKIMSIALLFALSWQTNAQSTEKAVDLKRNELKLDVAWLIFEPALKVEYEYFLNEWSSFGASGFINLSTDDYIKSQLLGLYRLYFGKEPRAGFFLEGNFGLTFGKDSNYGTYRHENYTNFGIGIALGWKYHIPKSDIVLDLYAGAGRLLGDNGPGGYPRFGICIGKRF